MKTVTVIIDNCINFPNDFNLKLNSNSHGPGREKHVKAPSSKTVSALPSFRSYPDFPLGFQTFWGAAQAGRHGNNHPKTHRSMCNKSASWQSSRQSSQICVANNSGTMLWSSNLRGKDNILEGVGGLCGCVRIKRVHL
eukprot:5977129-Amphidinium_carterae.1